MSKFGDYKAVADDIKALLHQPEYDDGSAGPVLVRLAWHSAGTYCAETDTGGSNGAGMRYEVFVFETYPPPTVQLLTYVYREKAETPQMQASNMLVCSSSP